jgi:hypothetical protein
VAESPKFVRSQVSSRSASGLSPGKAESCSSRRLLGYPAHLLDYSDRSGFTSMCSWQRKQKKASSLIIKRHLRLIGKLRGRQSGPPASPPLPDLRAVPSPSQSCRQFGKARAKLSWGWGWSTPGARPAPHPGRPDGVFPLKWQGEGASPRDPLRNWL